MTTKRMKQKRKVRSITEMKLAIYDSLCEVSGGSEAQICLPDKSWAEYWEVIERQTDNNYQNELFRILPFFRQCSLT